MELTRAHVEAFRAAYKQDTGEELSFTEASEMAHRLLNIFLILERAAIKKTREEQAFEEDDEDDE